MQCSGLRRPRWMEDPIALVSDRRYLHMHLLLGFLVRGTSWSAEDTGLHWRVLSPPRQIPEYEKVSRQLCEWPLSGGQNKKRRILAPPRALEHIHAVATALVAAKKNVVSMLGRCSGRAPTTARAHAPSSAHGRRQQFIMHVGRAVDARDQY